VSRALAVSFALVAFTAMAGGCSTLTTPVLRHETGETLGVGHFRFSARMQSSRIFALLPPGSGAVGVAQRAEVFQGSVFGLNAAAGVFPKFDAQVAGYILQSGGGWKIGGKYEIHRRGALAVGGTLAYGASSGAGSVTYLSAGELEDVNQVLTSKTIELSIPVSFRFTSNIVIYSGLTYWHSEVSGSVKTSYMVEPANDLGVNLGLRLNIGVVEGDVEVAILRFYDPFSDGMRMLPFFGMAVGIVF
jgi:hypothetical protein